ncbi:MAG TPA: hypothetical protein PKZ76_01685, partial [Xanthomonadaceae bacterium]|nr:hypothetical protein [Xanthomonadaceae bacterium]
MRPYLLIILCGIGLHAAAQDRPIAFVGATLIPIEGEPVTHGTLLVHEGRIQALGTELAIPDDARVRDVRGRVILPGLVDTHSHIGQVAGADASGPIQPDVRALDSINVRHAGIRKARA